MSRKTLIKRYLTKRAIDVLQKNINSNNDKKEEKDNKLSEEVEKLIKKAQKIDFEE